MGENNLGLLGNLNDSLNNVLDTLKRSLSDSDVAAESQNYLDAPDEKAEVIDIGDDGNQLGSGCNKIVLKVEDLTYEVGKKKDKKDILHGVNATYCSGELVAVMGPSGAGKTTFLNILSNSRSDKQIRKGRLSLNGEPLPKGYTGLCSYIPQNDVLYPALTPRQLFKYAALLRLPKSTTEVERNTIVNKLIKDLNLEKAADTVVGNESRRGISGGEKKRASIGLELIVNPAIILVDEPTSGLDSKMAEDIIEMLQSIAHKNGRLVLCTIHQPSWKVYQRFDKLTLLNHGNIVYHGKSREIITYFNELKLEVPSYENPLDFYFRELQIREAAYFADSWQELNTNALTSYETNPGNEFPKQQLTSGKELVDGWSSNDNSMWHQFYYLLRRAAQDTIRDKEKFVQGLVMKLAIGVLLGIIFFGQADGTNPSIFTANSALFFVVLSSVMDTTMKSLMEYPQIKPLVVREYRNGAFDILPYFLAQIVNNTIFETIASMFYMPAYFLVGLNTDANKIFYFVGILFFLTILGVQLGLLIGANTADIKEAQGYFIPIIMPQLLFAGFLIPPDRIPVYFKWIYDISFFQYGLSATLINEFEDVDFSDCPQNDFIPPTENSSLLPEFALPCFPDGEAYLDSLDLEPDYLGRNMLILIGFVAVFMPLTYLSVRHAIKTGAANV